MRLKIVAIAFVALTVGACGDLTTRPDPHGTGPPRSVGTTSYDPQLLVCPTPATKSQSGVIGPAGGTIGVGGTSIDIPAGAVSTPTVFDVVVPASNYMEIEISARGMDNYTFAQPVTVTINYARCPSGAVPSGVLLEGVYIDPSTNAVLAVMGGEDDKPSHKVSFSTDHLSGYAVAY